MQKVEKMQMKSVREVEMAKQGFYKKIDGIILINNCFLRKTAFVCLT